MVELRLTQVTNSKIVVVVGVNLIIKTNEE